MEPNGGQVLCGVTEHGSPCGAVNFKVLETALAARFHRIPKPRYLFESPVATPSAAKPSRPL
jgi:hypothetical protein